MNIEAGQVAVVTGAASGIGRALSAHFLREGMSVVMADIEQTALGQARSSLDPRGERTRAIACDVADEAAVDALASASRAAFGRVDIVCLNAGVVARFAPLWQQPAGEWNWAFGVNVFGLAHGIRAFVPLLAAQKRPAHIVITASEAALAPRPYVSIYHASKHAALAIAEGLAMELALEGLPIRVSALCPGGVNTRVMDAARNRDDRFGMAPDDAGARAAALEAVYRDALSRTGMASDEVAANVIEAIRADRFYVFPHDYVRQRTIDRAQAIADGVYPTPDAGLARAFAAASR